DDEVILPKGTLFYPVFFDEQNYPIYGMSDVMPYPSSRDSSMDEEAVSRFKENYRSQLIKAVEEFNPDIIYCHHLFLLAAYVRELFPEKFIIGQCHGSDLRQFKTSVRLQDYVRKGIQGLDRICALHGEQKNEICELYGVSPELVRVVGSGYNVEFFNTEGRKEKQSGEPLNLLFAGKISKPKGVPELLGAVRQLSDADVSKFRLRLIGGCQDEEVRAQIDDLISYVGEGRGSCESVEYLGFVDQDVLISEFKAGDVFVLPSYFEGLGLVLIEAMASGMVPVATRLPGIKEWIDESIPGSNVIYVAMPEMESVDKPFDRELPAFTERLARGINEAFALCESGFEQPDTSAIGWDSIAKKITNT
ncbi:MAG: glycosyltransferase, partial [Mogibacterium sp.]|nr:glycosyltransferase [Mogibacterium sp.]